MADSMQEPVPIPEPAGLPLLGHVRALEPDFPLGSMLSLAQTHGTTALPRVLETWDQLAKPRDQERSTGYGSRTGPPSSCPQTPS